MFLGNQKNLNTGTYLQTDWVMKVIFPLKYHLHEHAITSMCNKYDVLTLTRRYFWYPFEKNIINQTFSPTTLRQWIQISFEKKIMYKNLKGSKLWTSNVGTLF